MLDFDSFRGLLGEHFIEQELRRSEYTVTAGPSLRARATDEDELRAMVQTAIRRALSLPLDPVLWCGQWDSRPRITTKRALRQVPRNEWVEQAGNHGSQYVRRDSSAGFLLLTQGTKTSDDEVGFGQTPVPSGGVRLSLAWTQLGAVSCLYRSGEARGRAGWWQLKIENAIREAGFDVKMGSDWLK
jgi:hypothetical protein